MNGACVVSGLRVGAVNLRWRFEAAEVFLTIVDKTESISLASGLCSGCVLSVAK